VGGITFQLKVVDRGLMLLFRKWTGRNRRVARSESMEEAARVTYRAQK